MPWGPDCQVLGTRRLETCGWWTEGRSYKGDSPSSLVTQGHTDLNIILITQSEIFLNISSRLHIKGKYLHIKQFFVHHFKSCMSTVGLRLQFGNLLIPSGSHVGRSMPMTGMLHGLICICVCIVLYLYAGWSVFDCRSALAATWEATSSYSRTDPRGPMMPMIGLWNPWAHTKAK